MIVTVSNISHFDKVDACLGCVSIYYSYEMCVIQLIAKAEMAIFHEP